MADYLSLEDAAKKLGIPTDRLVELRSQGQVRGFRDGASWKFPENEIDRVADDLPDLLSSGSGILVNESGLGSAIGSGSGSIIGGDEPGDGDGDGSDIELGGEPSQPGSSSDVNLVPAEGDGSDVAIVASDSELMFDSVGTDLVEIDSAELNIDEPAVGRDSGMLDLAIEPQDGSTGPATDAEQKEISESHPDILAPESSENLLKNESDLSIPTEDDHLIDAAGDSVVDAAKIAVDSGSSVIDAMGSDIELKAHESKISGDILSSGGVSSLELMSDLDMASEPVDIAAMGSRGANVLSELDLLSNENQGSGLISGDSQDLLGSSDLGSSMHGDKIEDAELSGLDDALADDDDLIIADDDDDLVIGSSEGGMGSGLSGDLSVSGDSGINLMSPSDSGLSLESEPADLGGSNISALDLGAELADGSGISSGSGIGSGVDFQADEEFQLSPSGIGLEADIESGSQVIEIEDSGAIAEQVEISDDAFADAEALVDGDVFAAEPADGDAGFAAQQGGFDDAGEAIALDESAAPAVVAAAAAYEVPFSMFQCVGLMMILLMMGLSGMLMTDLVRNMWAYSEASAPVSSLTDSLISLMGWNP